MIAGLAVIVVIGRVDSSVHKTIMYMQCELVSDLSDKSEIKLHGISCQKEKHLY